MTPRVPRRGAVSLVAALALLAGASDARGQGRYELAVDPASRSGFSYVRDTETGRWVSRECELRVDSARPLPEPLTDDAHGDRLSVQVFDPVSLGSAGLTSVEPQLRDGHLVWTLRDVLDEDDLAGRVAYGVQVSWPREGEETRHDAMEIFRLPPLGDEPPDRWAQWTRAADQRSGAFGWWEEVYGAPPESLPAPEHPFELRCRLRLGDTPALP